MSFARKLRASHNLEEEIREKWATLILDLLCLMIARFVMDQFNVTCVVWASARGDIFWPGEVSATVSIFSSQIFCFYLQTLMKSSSQFVFKSNLSLFH